MGPMQVRGIDAAFWRLLWQGFSLNHQDKRQVRGLGGPTGPALCREPADDVFIAHMAGSGTGPEVMIWVGEGPRIFFADAEHIRFGRKRQQLSTGWEAPFVRRCGGSAFPVEDPGPAVAKSCARIPGLAEAAAPPRQSGKAVIGRLAVEPEAAVGIMLPVRFCRSNCGFSWAVSALTLARNSACAASSCVSAER